MTIVRRESSTMRVADDACLVMLTPEGEGVDGMEGGVL
jgi:hypothetical protein